MGCRSSRLTRCDISFIARRTIAIDLVTNFRITSSRRPIPRRRYAWPRIHTTSSRFADRIYVTDGGRNTVWQVDVPSGASSTLVEFPTIPNPAFPTIGGPVVEAVPTGISTRAGQLLVTLFRGFPFPAGTSSVERVHPATGSRTTFIDGLKTAIDILAVRSETVEPSRDYLVLQHA